MDFEPAIDSKRLRIGLMKQHDHLFGMNKAFDGQTLYSLVRLEEAVTEVTSVKQFDQASVNITVKHTNQLASNSFDALRMFNLIFKRLTKFFFFFFFFCEIPNYAFELNVCQFVKKSIKKTIKLGLTLIGINVVCKVLFYFVCICQKCYIISV